MVAKPLLKYLFMTDSRLFSSTWEIRQRAKVQLYVVAKPDRGISGQYMTIGISDGFAAFYQIDHHQPDGIRTIAHRFAGDV